MMPRGGVLMTTNKKRPRDFLSRYPGAHTFLRPGVEKSLYRVEQLDHPMFIAAPISQF